MSIYRAALASWRISAAFKVLFLMNGVSLHGSVGIITHPVSPPLTCLLFFFAETGLSGTLSDFTVVVVHFSTREGRRGGQGGS